MQNHNQLNLLSKNLVEPSIGDFALVENLETLGCDTSRESITPFEFHRMLSQRTVTLEDFTS
jgi:hypothetical protein